MKGLSFLFLDILSLEKVLHSLSYIYINKTCIFGIIQVFLYLPLFVFLCSADGGDNEKAI